MADHIDKVLEAGIWHKFDFSLSVISSRPYFYDALKLYYKRRHESRFGVRGGLLKEMKLNFGDEFSPNWLFELKRHFCEVLEVIEDDDYDGNVGMLCPFKVMRCSLIKTPSQEEAAALDQYNKAEAALAAAKAALDKARATSACYADEPAPQQLASPAAAAPLAAAPPIKAKRRRLDSEDSDTSQ